MIKDLKCDDCNIDMSIENIFYICNKKYLCPKCYSFVKKEQKAFSEKSNTGSNFIKYLESLNNVNEYNNPELQELKGACIKFINNYKDLNQVFIDKLKNIRSCECGKIPGIESKIKDDNGNWICRVRCDCEESGESIISNPYNNNEENRAKIKAIDNWNTYHGKDMLIETEFVNKQIRKELKKILKPEFFKKVCKEEIESIIPRILKKHGYVLNDNKE